MRRTSNRSQQWQLRCHMEVRLKKKSDLRRDLDTLKKLDTRQKLEFLWDYYKWRILVTACILVIVVIFAHILWEGQRPCRLRVCVVLNTEDDCSDWFSRFTLELKADGKPGDVDVNQDQPFDYDNAYSYVFEMEVMTAISSKRIDIAVCGPDLYHYLLSLNACLPLDTALSEDLALELSSRGMLCFDRAGLTEDENGKTDFENGIEGYFAVDLSGTEFYETYNHAAEGGEPLYAVIISNTEHQEDCEALLRALIAP